MSGNRDGWRDVGKSLMRGELEIKAADIHTALNQVSGKIANDQCEVTARDVERLYGELEELENLVDELAKVPDDYQRPPKFYELATEAEYQEILTRDPSELDEHRSEQEPSNGGKQ